MYFRKLVEKINIYLTPENLSYLIFTINNPCFPKDCYVDCCRITVSLVLLRKKLNKALPENANPSLVRAFITGECTDILICLTGR